MKDLINIDIFDKIKEADAICITTNCTILQDGSNPMGALAGAAAMRWTQVPKTYGKLLCLAPNVPVIIGYISKENEKIFIPSLEDLTGISSRTHTALVAYPTMLEIGEPANLKLVKRSAKLLSELADLFFWHKVYTGRPGCGVGGLDYEKEVRPALHPILDERFIIMHKEFSVGKGIHSLGF